MAATLDSSPRPRGAARRAALLEATLRVIADVGPDAVTHRRVADEAQLPLASTTYWFESKEHLLTEALRYAADNDLLRLEAAAQRLHDGPVTPADIVAVIADAGSSRGSLMATYALLLEAARRPALRELSRRWGDAYVDTTAALLDRAGSPSPRADARLLLAAADGLAIDRLATGTTGTAEDHAELQRLIRTLVAAR